jgi:sulfur-carrier protein
MSITIEIPSALRRFTDNRAAIRVADADDVNAAVDALVQQFPPLRKQLLAQDGGLFGFIGVFVNGRDIRQLTQASTPLRSGDVVSLVPAIAGG